MGNYVRHEPCPKCGSRDNLARYDDGSGYCFGCAHSEPASKRKAVKVFKEAYKTSFTEVATLPPKWVEELTRRGLNASEQALFKYSPELDRLIWRDGDFAEARCFFGKQPKTLSFGNKAFHVIGEGERIVLVEDIFSAIRVGRVTAAVPLFGSVIPKPWMMLLAKLTSKVTVWLDSDKYQEAIKQARALRLLGPDVTVLNSPKDPKEYSTQDIINWLKQT